MEFGVPVDLTGFMLVPHNVEKDQHILRNVLTIARGTLGLERDFSIYINQTEVNKMSYLQQARQIGEKENLLPIYSVYEIINEN